MTAFRQRKRIWNQAEIVYYFCCLAFEFTRWYPIPSPLLLQLWPTYRDESLQLDSCARDTLSGNTNCIRTDDTVVPVVYLTNTAEAFEL